ncbi:hypothetical protein [Bacillus rhizoplanae]|uniref:hypothetical protein n=1 Tax=Bacillus rhizoplanae TaxID=2880966 RepID=UPI003D21BBE7
MLLTLQQHNRFPSLQHTKSFTFLGEGAWHNAYLAETNDGPFVVRIPKKVAYDKEITFNETALLAEYRGTALYYEKANLIRPNICPEQFYYYVSPDLTYTVESFAGRTLSLDQETEASMQQYGYELGQFYYEMDQVPANEPGIGYFTWKNGKMIGEITEDANSFFQEETTEYKADITELYQAGFSVDLSYLFPLIDERIFSNITLTNQDNSLENLLLSNKQLRIIDPYPILYTGESLAANFIHNYRFTFPYYFNTERYKKHNFHTQIKKLRAMADGFCDGYTTVNKNLQFALDIECTLKMTNMIYNHYKALQQPLTREQEIRMGTHRQIEDRLQLLLSDLQQMKIR